METELSWMQDRYEKSMEQTEPKVDSMGLLACECGATPTPTNNTRLYWVECVSQCCVALNPTTRLCKTKRTAIKEWNAKKYLG